MNDPVFQLQSDVWGCVSGHPFFADVACINNERGVIGDDIEAALKLFTSRNGKKGASVVVDRPLRRVEKPDAPGPEMVVIVPVTIAEMPLINRVAGGTGRTTEELASELMSLLHGWRPSGMVSELYCAEDAVSPTVGNDRVIATEVQFRCRMRFAPGVRVATPVISGDSTAGVGIAVNMPGAVIYYTTDGSWPWPGNGAAERYGVTLLTEDGIIIITEDGNPLNVAGPLQLSPGTLLRVAAYSENKQGSSGAAATIK